MRKINKRVAARTLEAIAVMTLLQIGVATAACSTARISDWNLMPVLEAPSAHPRAYEVASIRPSNPGGNDGGQLRIDGDRFMADGLSVQQLVFIAYEITNPDQVAGLPQWTYSARFDIEAKLEDDATERQKLPVQQELEHSRVILRELLEDRFALKTHIEKRERPAYTLLIDRHGVKLQEAGLKDHSVWDVRKGQIRVRAATMAPFIDGLSRMVGRSVIDKTGLVGRYNIDLQWAPDELGGTGDAGPSIFTALREQLGLRLVSTRAPISVLVVDHLERPSPN